MTTMLTISMAPQRFSGRCSTSPATHCATRCLARCRDAQKEKRKKKGENARSVVCALALPASLVICGQTELASKLPKTPLRSMIDDIRLSIRTPQGHRKATTQTLCVAPQETFRPQDPPPLPRYIGGWVEGVGCVMCSESVAPLGVIDDRTLMTSS